jgi:hypothetical protein
MKQIGLLLPRAIFSGTLDSFRGDRAKVGGGSADEAETGGGMVGVAAVF